ncbi:WD40-repeat-containing domain protein [Endogone sp. FLAS-F59071]|nr:WD40-repeat-containing domain protein [Endogone sp. FLAS-F59071]|eukprot:RUS15873.1 WD40-repeat-containing domain protein [Endogone sp. FLAS-F59071]
MASETNPSTQPPSTGTTAGAAQQPNTEQIALEYLRSKGYRGYEAIVRQGPGTLTLQDLVGDLDPKSLPGYAQKYAEGEMGSPEVHDVSYRKLREWIENSLDWYKSELRSLLFPIFVHTYLDLVTKGFTEQARHFMATYRVDHPELHTPDLTVLATVITPQHARENERARSYRENKYGLRMSTVPWELFYSFMQDNKLLLIQGIVNQYLDVEVRKTTGLESDDVVGITGHPGQQLDVFNQQKVTLGQLPQEAGLREEVEQNLKDEDIRRAQQQGGDHSMNGDASSLLDTYKRVKQEAGMEGPAPGEIPLPPYRGTDVQAELDAIKDLRKRLLFGPGSLPSVCCYTFHNTHDGMTCLSISEDTSLIAGGFSESYIKVWSLKGEKLRGLKNNINPAHVNDRHSGPVFGVSFSHDNKYLISCSEDKTARLWSTATFTNLVVYKGHNYPVWDVDFGPYGFYFATASHDRTARLWSCDHIYPLRIFAGHLSDVDCVKFHPNSKYIVTGSSDRTARLWDVQRGTCVRVFTGHTGSINAVAVSPDGRLMASAGEDRAIMLWDLGSGRRLKRMTGHTGLIYSLDFSADNAVLVSGAADCTVRVWDVKKEVGGATAVVVGAAQQGGKEGEKRKKGMEEEKANGGSAGKEGEGGKEGGKEGGERKGKKETRRSAGHVPHETYAHLQGSVHEAEPLSRRRRVHTRGDGISVMRSYGGSSEMRDICSGDGRIGCGNWEGLAGRG